MVPNLTKGAGIKGTALYVLHDERTLEEKAIGAELTAEYQSAHRRGFTATRNLSTDDPDLAWRLMCATAKSHEDLKRESGTHRGGRRVEKFCGHLSLAWEHGAEPDRAEMMKAAEGALTALGWEKLQALIVEHTDHDHKHCHIVVNLIDPETGRAAPNAKNDFDKLQKWAFEYERDRGEIVCERRAERMEAAEQGERTNPRREWLPRKEWEAQRAAEREAAKLAQAERKAAIMAETKERIKQQAADVREQFRSEWAALYREQRQQMQQMEREQAAQLRQLDKAMPRHSSRVEYFNQHSGQLWAALDGKDFATVEALTSPTTLTAATQQAQAAQRAALEQEQAAAKAELAQQMEAARHEGQREIWRDHNERVRAGQPIPEPANANQPTPEQAKPTISFSYHLKPEANRYAGLHGRTAENPASIEAEKTAADPYKDFRPIRESIRPDAPASSPAASREPPKVEAKHAREEINPRAAVEAAQRREQQRVAEQAAREAEAARAAEAKRLAEQATREAARAAEKKRGEELAAQLARYSRFQQHRGRERER